MIKIIFSKIIGLVFLLMGWVWIRDFTFSAQHPLISVFQIWFSYFVFYSTGAILLSEAIERNKTFSFIYTKILIIPFIGFIYFQYLVAPLLTIIIFLGFYLLPSMLVITLSETYTIIQRYEQGIIYLLSLGSVLLFAYKSNIVMNMIIESFKTKLLKASFERYASPLFTRIGTYLFMVFIYVTYNFLTFSNISLDFIPNEILNVVKEVFVTFVAVDTLIQINSSNRNNPCDVSQNDKRAI